MLDYLWMGEGDALMHGEFGGAGHRRSIHTSTWWSVNAYARTSEADTCNVKNGHGARVLKRRIMRLVRKVLTRGEAWWRGRRLTPGDRPHLFPGGCTDMQKATSQTSKRKVQDHQGNGGREP